MAAPRFRKARAHKSRIDTSGTGMTSLTATSKTAPNSPNLDLVLPASVGDVIVAGLDFIWAADSSAGQGIWDVATIVSSAAVSWVSGHQGTGFGGFGGTYSYGDGTNRHPASGQGRWTIVAGDLASGKVTVRPYYVVTGGTKAILWGSNTPWLFWVENIGPGAAH